MKNIIYKYISNAKGFLSKSVNFNPKVFGLTAIILIIALFISFNIGSSHKLDKLVAQEAQTTVEKIKQSDSELTSEIDNLSARKDALNSDLANKANAQAAMQQYKSDKENYTKQVSQLTNDIGNLDSSIKTKQTELNNKKAAKQEELRVAAEKAAREAEAARQANMVWIGDTGTKYHNQYCRTLRGNKYQITLDEAKAQGRTACKVCGG